MTELDKLRKVIAERTKGPWNFEDERFSALCVIGNKPNDDRWIAHCQSAFNGYRNGNFIATMGTHADLLMAVIDAADAFLRQMSPIYMCDYGPSRREALERLEESLTALKQALGENNR